MYRLKVLKMESKIKTYSIINISDLPLIDFSQILQNSEFTIRKSLDNAKFVIKWEQVKEPTFIKDGSVVPVGIYTHSEILEIMATAEWSEIEIIKK
jgi:hypothetical protein